jgi:hypothetical protein
MIAELKTVHSFWTPLRILDKLKRTTEEIEKEQGIKITPNQLAMNLIDVGLHDEKMLNRSISRKKEAPPVNAVVNMVRATHNNHIRGMTSAYVDKSTLAEEADSSTG